MAYDNDNIFARIVRGEIPCHKVYEDAETLAFMDIMPQSEAHLSCQASAEDIFTAPRSVRPRSGPRKKCRGPPSARFSPPGVMIAPA